MPRTPWYRSCFTEHPSFATRDAAAFSGTKRTHDKVKVWCRKCLDKHVEDVMDVELSNFLFHQSDVLHERDEILRECWDTENGGWMPCQTARCLVHLRDCELQPDDVRSKAKDQQDLYNMKRRKGKAATADLSPTAVPPDPPPNASVYGPQNDVRVAQPLSLATEEALGPAVPRPRNVSPTVIRSQEAFGELLQHFQQISIDQEIVYVPVSRAAWVATQRAPPPGPSTNMAFAQYNDYGAQAALPANMNALWMDHSPVDAQPQCLPIVYPTNNVPWDTAGIQTQNSHGAQTHPGMDSGMHSPIGDWESAPPHAQPHNVPVPPEQWEGYHRPDLCFYM